MFYNLCRHRGAPLASEPCHLATGLLTCPYHAWTYRLDGRLFRAPQFDREQGNAPDEDTAAALGLIELRSALWRDIVFVNVDGEALPFEQFIAPLDERTAYSRA